MATKNLSPRSNGEGQIGTSTKKWKTTGIETGSFDNVNIESDNATLMIDGKNGQVQNREGRIVVKGAQPSYDTNESFGSLKFYNFDAEGFLANYYSAGIEALVGDGEDEAYLTFWTREDNSTMQENMRIDNVGNVGIANTNPQTKLHVNGTISGSLVKGPKAEFDKYSSIIVDEANSYIMINAKSLGYNEKAQFIMIGAQESYSSSATFGAIKFHNMDAEGYASPVYAAGIEAFIKGDEDSSAIKFSTRASNVTPLQRMVIDEDGNVGINVTNPNNKLQVAGTISGSNLSTNGTCTFNGVVSDGSAGIDQVVTFADYQDNEHVLTFKNGILTAYSTS